MKDKLSSSPKDNDTAELGVSGHRRTNSFSSFAKSYRSKAGSDKSSKIKLSKVSSNGTEHEVVAADSQVQMITLLELKVSEGERIRKELHCEITRLKEQLQKAEAHISLLKHELQLKSCPPSRRGSYTEKSCLR